MKEEDQEAEEIPIQPQHLADLISLVDKGTISNTIAKKVFDKMYDTKKDPKLIVKEEGLEVVSDEGALLEVVKKVLENNPQSVADYKNGKKKAMGFLVGQAMRETRGKADPQIINKLSCRNYLNRDYTRYITRLKALCLLKRVEVRKLFYNRKLFYHTLYSGA